MSEALQTLKRKSQSFYWAGLLLPARVRMDVAELYAFCRAMDDAVDEQHSPQYVEHAQHSLPQTYPHIHRLCQRYDIQPQVMEAFLSSLLADQPPVRHASLGSLLRFAYGAAGTVGIMMSHVLGARTPQALYRAVDLGIAMQLVNIARDRASDLAAQRDYLPPGHAPATLVVLAEDYFTSGMAGIALLPWPMRPAIMTAALVYREIGMVLLARPENALRQRVVVPRWRKLQLTFRALILVAAARRPASPHLAALHAELAGLPHTHHAGEPS
ncbi:MAG: squalene/phytoene synthase family protein [Alphaproteobacteria bacterium]|nr:squalene/phytoene synthase family protein [Alphaproteobacteria bacterium]